jgi:hypothetical protein
MPEDACITTGPPNIELPRTRKKDNPSILIEIEFPVNRGPNDFYSQIPDEIIAESLKRIENRQNSNSEIITPVIT